MRTLALILAMWPVVVLAQFENPAIVGALTYSTVSAPPASWSPTNITGAALYVNYLDLPTSGKPAGWTNELSSFYFIQNGATYPTNSSSGMYFDGTGFFTNSGSGVSMNLTTNSIWVCLKPVAFSGAPSVIAGHQAATYSGFSLQFNSTFLFHQYGENYSSPTCAANILYDIALHSTNSSGTIYPYMWTNGVQCSPGPNPCLEMAQPDSDVFGLGADGAGDPSANMYLLAVLICTNHVFTPAEITNVPNGLHWYATNNLAKGVK